MDQIIVSDANTFLIESILKHYELEKYFNAVHTNPSHFDENDQLRVRWHHDHQIKGHHNCSFCPKNMCKGSILEKLFQSNPMETWTRIAYVGDGGGDFCPCLKLRYGSWFFSALF